MNYAHLKFHFKCMNLSIDPEDNFEMEPEKRKTREAWRRRGFLEMKLGAGKRNRTPDLRITNALLYRLSYSGIRETRL